MEPEYHARKLLSTKKVPEKSQNQTLQEQFLQLLR
jgi:hypothetical protein